MRRSRFPKKCLGKKFGIEILEDSIKPIDERKDCIIKINEDSARKTTDAANILKASVMRTFFPKKDFNPIFLCILSRSL